MDSKRKSYTPEYKLKVVLESMQRDTTQEEVCKKFGISSSMFIAGEKSFRPMRKASSRINAIPSRRPNLKDMSRDNRLTT